ncbi:polysaccharide lyase [Wenzhouxiangella sp. XN24]|uniref:polysaccharide lyase n=1 Tax=Wenzhouxiangella sp. XN24 TaxID=2713569 RepID=UPI0013ECDC3D|nr:hypothetical protein [Wenzhouxiangella sp. XN24]NGX16874.1 hypothetical protein [Wenzhouxiangella sp. XN24]
MKILICSTLAGLAMLAPMVGSASECAQWQPAQPAWLWCDDFSSNDALESRYEDVGGTGMSISGDVALSPPNSLRQSYESGQVSAGWIAKVEDTGFPDHIFVRWYHLFADGFSTFPPKMARVRYRERSDSWETEYAVHAWVEPDGELVADVFARNSTQANASGWLPKASSGFRFAGRNGQWVAIEMEVKLNTPGSRDGHYRFWVDGELVIERLDIDLRGGRSEGINEVMLDAYWNGGATGQLDRYYDNLVISTERIGLITTASPPRAPGDVRVD